VVYAKRPFGGPDAVLAYLSRYPHWIAIASSRLVAFDGEHVTFKWKDYRSMGDARYTLMTLDPTGQARGLKAPDEFIRHFLIHVLPHGFRRIRHYGLFANATAPAISHRLVSSSAYPIRFRQATEAMAREMVSNTKSETLVLAAAGA